MAGARIKNISGSQTLFDKNLVLLIDKIDTGTDDWPYARKLPLKLIGNTYYQGSSNGVDWHDEILSNDTFIRFSTGGGEPGTWVDLNTTNVREGDNLYFTEARVLATTGIQDTVDNSHIHTNKTLLDNIIDTGDGTTFLSDKGTYKNLSHKSLTTKTNNYTITSVDEVILLDGTSNTVTISLPTAVGNEGTLYIIKCINDTFTCDITTSGSEEIDGDSSNFELALHEVITVISNNIGWYLI